MHEIEENHKVLPQTGVGGGRLTKIGEEGGR